MASNDDTLISEPCGSRRATVWKGNMTLPSGADPNDYVRLPPELMAEMRRRQNRGRVVVGAVGLGIVAVIVLLFVLF